MTNRSSALFVLPLMAGLLAVPVAAQQAGTAAPARTDSGVIAAPRQERIPLEQFMAPLRCPEDEICIEGEPEVDPDLPPPEPGDRELDAAAERRALSNLGREQLPTECGAPIGPGFGTACAFEVFEEHSDERDLLDSRYLPPEEPE